MPKRTTPLTSVTEQYYLRKEGSTKVVRIYSPEQLEEMLEDGRITEKDKVGIMISKEGLGSSRKLGAEKSEKKKKVRVIDTTKDDGIEIGEYL